MSCRRGITWLLLLSGTGCGGSDSTAPSGPGPASQLHFLSGPHSAIAGASLATAIEVEVRDADGVRVTDGSVAISLSIAPETNPGGATRENVVGTSSSAGVATFPNPTIQKAGTNYILRATSPGLFSASSGAFTIAASSPTSLFFLVEPSSVVAGVSIGPAVQLALSDTFGNRLASTTQGIVVALAPGTGGAGATLSGGKVRVVAAGVATFADLRVDKAASGYELFAQYGDSLSALSSTFSVSAAASTGLAITSGNNQTDTVAHTLLDTLRVRLTDAWGNPVIGVGIAWTPAQGSANPQTSATNSLGEASTTWQLGQSSGTQSLGASTAAGPSIQVTFLASARAGTPSQMARTAGDSQEAAAGHTFSLPLQAKVVDAFGNAVPGSPITWSSSQGRATISVADSVTSVQGVGSATVTAGTVRGTDTITATGPLGLHTAFLLHTLSGPIRQIRTVAGDSQSVIAGAHVPTPPAVIVADTFGNPISGAPVQFLDVNPANTVTGSSTVTDSGGVATVGSWKLYSPGTWTLTATVGAAGIPGNPVSFTGAAASPLTIVSGDSQSAQILAAVPSNPRVKLVDTLGQPLVGVQVAWMAGYNWRESIAGLRLGYSSTGANGEAILGPWTLGETPGSQLLEASVGAYYVDFHALGTGTPIYQKAQSLALGATQSCALDLLESVWCWGTSTSTGLDDAGLAHSVTPVPLAGGESFRSIASSFTSAATVCGVVISGAVRCWGGVSTRFTGPNYVEVVAGNGHFCARSADSLAYCWGDNSSGQLGDSSTTYRSSPVPVAGGLRFTALSAGGAHSCGIVGSGAAYCWGADSAGQLGDGTNQSRSYPAPVFGGFVFRQLVGGGLSGGDSFTCGLTIAGNAMCWGRQATSFGAWFDFGTTPRALYPGYQFKSIAAGRRSACAILMDSTVACWGTDFTGINDVGFSGSVPPVSYPDLQAKSVVIGPNHKCIVNEQDVVVCIGINYYDALGWPYSSDLYPFMFQPTRVLQQVMP